MRIGRPYFTWYRAREWGVHRSVDLKDWALHGGRKRNVVQVNIGRLGITIPVGDKRG